jgi:hypothetical protein
MEDKETVYDILNHFKNTKNRLTQGCDSDFITLDYKQLLALIELSKREQQEQVNPYDIPVAKPAEEYDPYSFMGEQISLDDEDID